jgi:hypothetical protein
MTRETFVDWLKVHGCKQEAIEGVNVTARQIKFVNPTNNRYVYVDLPIDDREVADYQVMHASSTLAIPYPDCVQHEEKRFNHFKDKYGKR